MSNSNVEYQKTQLKKKIAELRKQRTTIFVDSGRQILEDHIKELKNQLYALDAPVKKVVPVMNAPTVKDRKRAPQSSIRSGRAYI